MNASPIDTFLAVLDKLDLDAAVAMFEPDGRFLAVDGRDAKGIEAIRALLENFLAGLRSTTHTITAQWHQDTVWIAEVDASYVLQDHLKLDGLLRAFVLREGLHGFSDLRVYGAHERQLADHDTTGGGLWVGRRWIPAL